MIDDSFFIKRSSKTFHFVTSFIVTVTVLCGFQNFTLKTEKVLKVVC